MEQLAAIDLLLAEYEKFGIVPGHQAAVIRLREALLLSTIQGVTRPTNVLLTSEIIKLRTLVRMLPNVKNNPQKRLKTVQAIGVTLGAIQQMLENGG